MESEQDNYILARTAQRLACSMTSQRRDFLIAPDVQCLIIREEQNQMENQKQIEDDWRKGLDVSLHPKLKIADGESVKFVFLDEGQKFKHPDYKPSVIFTVMVDGETVERTWFVNAEAYGTLNQIKILGKLTGLRVSVKRTGSKKSDTRYEVKKL